MTLRPWHSLQRSFAFMRSPWPRHSEQIDWICCMKPGPSCWTRTCVPVPLQVGHFSTDPGLPPYPVTITDQPILILLANVNMLIKNSYTNYFTMATVMYEIFRIGQVKCKWESKAIDMTSYIMASYLKKKAIVKFPIPLNLYEIFTNELKYKKFDR